MREPVRAEAQHTEHLRRQRRGQGTAPRQLQTPDPETPRDPQDPCRVMGQPVARIFDTVSPEGTIVGFDIEILDYAASYEAHVDTEV